MQHEGKLDKPLNHVKVITNYQESACSPIADY